MVAIAHVGYGYWGRNLARNFAELGGLRAVVDANPKAAAEAAAAYGAKAMTFDEVLADPAIEAISIASPAELHFSQASQSLMAGKHVFVEKPLALNVQDAEVLCKLAAKHDRQIMVGHLLLYHPVFLKLLATVRSGELGKLRYVYSNRLSLGKFRVEENVLWSFAPHDLSMILALFREEPSHVSAQGTVTFTPGVADLATAQMRFPGGGNAHLLVSWMHPVKEQKLVVIGDRAMAVFEDSEPRWEAKLKLFRHGIDTTGAVPVPTKAEPELISVPLAEPLREECRHFIECVQTGQVPRTSGRDGLAVLRVLQAAEAALAVNLGL